MASTWLIVAGLVAGGVLLARAGGVRDREGELEARLTPPDGGAAWGKAEWEERKGEPEELELSLRKLDLPDGTEAEVWIGERAAGRIVIAGGRGRLDLEARGGDEVPVVAAGDVVSVRLGDQVLLAGTFRPD